MVTMRETETKMTEGNCIFYEADGSKIIVPMSYASYDVFIQLLGKPIEIDYYNEITGFQITINMESIYAATFEYQEN